MQDEQTLPSSFGELLKTSRKRRCLTQQQLAQRLGVHPNTISSWELGTYLPATRGFVLELAHHLALDAPATRQLLDASLTAPFPHWQMPFARNPFFTGREAILEVLHAQLGVQQAVALTQSAALHGLGGIGKTQIALEYAYRHALEYSDVFWIEAETSERIMSSLLRLAVCLQLPERQNADQQRMLAAVQRWLTAHHQWLLIWDNLEDPELLHDFLPPTQQGAILITTRCSALGTLAVGVELLPMGQEEGLLFLLRRAKVLSPTATCEQMRQFAVRSPSDAAAAEEVAKALGGLPLALDQAGAYIEETGCSLADYFQRYDQQRTHLLDRRGEAGGNHPHSVTTTFRLLSERAAREQKAAADVLRVCAFLQAEAIPEELFVAGATHLGPAFEYLAADPVQFDQAIAALRRLSLVQRQAEAHTLSLHRLVQVVLREGMSEQERTEFRQRAVHALNALFPEVTHDTWEQCERLLSHVLVVSAAIPEHAEDQELAELLQKAADYLRVYARYEHARALYERALRIQEQALGPDHPDVASPLYGLGLICWKQGKYEQAKLLYQRALSLQEQVKGTEHTKVAHLLNGLAILSVARGKHEQAEPLYQQALAIRERQLGPEHPDTAESLNNLACLSIKQGKYEQAEQLCRQALFIWKRALGAEHPNVAFPFMHLAELSTEQGKYEQAEPLYQQALHIWEQALGPEHPQVAHALHGLAVLFTRQDLALFHQKQGNLSEALSLAERALKIHSKSLGDAHPKTVATRTLYAQLVQKQGFPLSRRAFTAQLKAHGCRADRTKTARVWRGITIVKKEPCLMVTEGDARKRTANATRV